MGWDWSLIQATTSNVFNFNKAIEAKCPETFSNETLSFSFLLMNQTTVLKGKWKRPWIFEGLMSEIN